MDYPNKERGGGGEFWPPRGHLKMRSRQSPSLTHAHALAVEQKRLRTQRAAANAQCQPSNRKKNIMRWNTNNVYIQPKLPKPPEKLRSTAKVKQTGLSFPH